MKRLLMILPVISCLAGCGNNVEVEQRTNADGMTELIVNISKKVASDYATGKNTKIKKYK